MATSKDSPRQKLIGMMYLVLTSLLALNVSKDILNAFIVINQGLENNHKAYEERMQEAMSVFQKLAQKDPEKVKPFLNKAQTIKDKSEQLQQYIQSLKKHIIAQTDQLDMQAPDSLFELRKAVSKDNYDVPTFILIGSDAGAPKGKDVENSALQLQHKMEEFKNLVLRQFDPKNAVVKEVQGVFNFSEVETANNTKEPWHLANFYHIPLAAVITNLSKLQSDVQNMEELAVKSLLENVNSKEHHFDQLEARVVPNSNYILLGDSFAADVFLSASSSSQDPMVEISQELDAQGNIKGKLDPHVFVSKGSGKARYTFKPNREGLVRWGGTVKIQKPGVEQAYDIYKIPIQEFLVSKPTLVVSPLNMNVVYRGLDNPVSIAVPGIPGEKLLVTPINCTITKSKEDIYQIKPGKDATCSVQVGTKQGSGYKNLGAFEFRVKNVPAPKATVAKVSGNASMTVSEFKKFIPVLGVSVSNPDFVFALNYKVKSFTISAIQGVKNTGEKSMLGASVNVDYKGLLELMARPGCKIYVSDIICEGPSGNQQLDPIIITLK